MVREQTQRSIQELKNQLDQDFKQLHPGIEKLACESEISTDEYVIHLFHYAERTGMVFNYGHDGSKKMLTVEINHHFYIS